jgi:hypothetical protein
MVVFVAAIIMKARDKQGCADGSTRCVERVK